MFSTYGLVLNSTNLHANAYYMNVNKSILTIELHILQGFKALIITAVILAYLTLTVTAQSTQGRLVYRQLHVYVSNDISCLKGQLSYSN